MRDQDPMQQRMLEVGDLLGRAGIVLYFSHGSWLKLQRLYAALSDWQASAIPQKWLWLASEVATLLFLALVVAITIFRLKPIRSAQGIEPRFSALAGTFLLVAIALTPSTTQPPPGVVALGFVLVAVGFGLSTYVLFWLGRSFSIMAEARKLVTNGPYAIVRHPLYVTEELAVIGIILLNLSPLAILIGIVHWGLQLRRMHIEEGVLRAAFPAYESYAQVTPRIFPQLPRPSPATSA